jgi:ABC-2 type transport system permease protein
MTTLAVELRKIPAFVRRDFLVAWSYRMSFVTDLVALAGQAVLFYFVSLMVDPAKIPEYGGQDVGYLAFAAVGMALVGFIHIGLDRVAHALRAEQLMGTLESVLTTPTAPTTIQLGSIAFDLIYVPFRMIVFLGALVLAFDLHFEAGGVPKAAVILLAFWPFVWGLGVISAALTLTFRRGSSLVGLGTLVLGILSGVYFPIDLLPGNLESIVKLNPVALAVQSMRDAVLGDASWSSIAPEVLILAPVSAAALVLGVASFRAALKRERRLGSLGVY